MQFVCNRSQSDYGVKDQTPQLGGGKEDHSGVYNTQTGFKFQDFIKILRIKEEAPTVSYITDT